MYFIGINNKQFKLTHWVSLFNDKNAAVHFDSFGIDYITQEVLNKVKDKSTLTTFLEYYLMTLLCVNFIVSYSLNI